MTPNELEVLFEKQRNESERHLCPAVVIEYQGERGIALKIGENLTESWQSGDIIVFWSGGDHTVLPDEFKLVSDNAFA